MTPGAHLAMSGYISDCHNWRGYCCWHLVYNGQMPLNIPPHTGQPPARTDPAPNDSRAELEKPSYSGTQTFKCVITVQCGKHVRKETYGVKKAPWRK